MKEAAGKVDSVAKAKLEEGAIDDEIEKISGRFSSALAEAIPASVNETASILLKDFHIHIFHNRPTIKQHKILDTSEYLKFHHSSFHRCSL